MIGTERLTLTPASQAWSVYRKLWQTLLSGDDKHRAFGPTLPALPSKAATLADESERVDSGLELLFLLLGLAVFADAMLDPNEFTTITLTFFAVILGLCGVGVWLALNLKQKPANWHCHRFLITLEAFDIGVGDICEDRREGICTFVLGLVPEYRNRKLGSVAARLLLRKCFTELNARRVETSAYSTNQPSVEMHDGMIQEGVLVGRVVIEGKPADEILFRLLKSEWEQQIATGDRNGSNRL